jgi:UDP-N-acetylglucosamine acyltransferase
MSYAGVNIVGLQRRQFAPDQIQTISQIYHLLFVLKSSTSTAIKAIEEQVQDGIFKKEILDFVQGSRIGIIKRASKNDLNDD